MKKLFLFVCLTGSLMFAQSNGVVPTQETKIISTCTKINILGIVQVWSGSTNVYAQNPNTGRFDILVMSIPCGKDGGSWDWFWE